MSIADACARAFATTIHLRFSATPFKLMSLATRAFLRPLALTILQMLEIRMERSSTWNAQMWKPIIVASLIIATLAGAPAQAGNKLGAVLGGVAVGAVGGAILGSALNAQARPAPVYAQPAPPPPTVEYVDPAPRRVVVRDEFDDRASRLHFQCDDGNKHACIRFGILIGQHRERVAQWRQSHPDYFSYED